MPKKHPEHVNLERWLVSYADFITLLFATFVVLYAISRADIQKFKAVAEGIRSAFSADFVEQHGHSSGKTLNQFETDQPVGGLIVDMPAGKNNIMTPDNEELKRLADIIEESVSYDLGATEFSEKMRLYYDDRGLVVRLAAKDFYDPGQAVVRKDALPVLDQMARALKTVKRHIRVEGHTDAGKGATGDYASNWELSTARAAWIVRYLIQKFQFDPALLEAAGCAEFRPIASNDTEAGRSRNRRVEILVLSKAPR